MSSSRARAIFLGAIGVVLCLGLKLVWDAAREEKTVALALDVDGAAALCRRARYPLGDFLERAKAIGFEAAAMGDQTPHRLAARGQVLVFPASEVEKWRALGFVAPGSPLRPNSALTKRPELAEALRQGAAAQGLTVSTFSSLGFRGLEFPAGYDIDELALGPDADEAAASASAGLEVIEASSARGEVSLDGRRASILRTSFSQERQPVLVRLGDNEDVEETLDRARALVQALERAGARPGRIAAWRAASAAKRGWAVWLLCLIAPLGCVRLALRTLARAQVYVENRAPVASPVAEVVCAAAAAWGAAFFAGLLARALGGWNPGVGGLVAPMILAAGALWAHEFPTLKQKLGHAMTYRALAKLLAAGLAVLFLLRPGWLATRLGAGVWAERLADFSSFLWCWPWRWREALVGFPCLIVALLAVHEKWACPECAPPEKAKAKRYPADPRPWLWLGILAPIGVQAALSNAALPFGAAAAQAAASALAGAALAVLIAASV